MYKKTLVHKVSIKWEQKYNKLKEKHDKLVCHVVTNKVSPVNSSYFGNAIRVNISVTIYPTDTENKLSYDEFIRNINSERIKNEFMKIYNRKE